MRVIEEELTRQGKRVDVLTVVGASHVRLAETNGVFAFGNTVEDFEVFLGDTLWAKRRATSGFELGCDVPRQKAYSVGEVHLHG